MSVEAQLLTEIVAASRARLLAQADLDAAITRRELALWRLAHEEGLTIAEISRLVRERLLADGFTAPDLAAVGVSRSSVRLAVSRPRPRPNP